MKDTKKDKAIYWGRMKALRPVTSKIVLFHGQSV